MKNRIIVLDSSHTGIDGALKERFLSMGEAAIIEVKKSRNIWPNVEVKEIDISYQSRNLNDNWRGGGGKRKMGKLK